MKHFLAFLFLAVSLLAQVPFRASRIDITDRPTSLNVRVSLTGASSQWFSGPGSLRIFMAGGGSSSGAGGIIRGYTGNVAGSETQVWSFDPTGILTNQSVHVQNASGAEQVTMSATSTNFLTTSGASRVFIAPGGSAGSTVGTLCGYTGAAGSETQVWCGNATGLWTNGDTRDIYGVDSGGRTRVRLTPYDSSVAGSRLQLFGGSGSNTKMVDFQGGASGGFFLVARNAAGDPGVYASGGFIAGQTMALGSDPFSPTGGWTYAGGTTASTYYALPSGGGAGDVGKVLGLTADHVTGWVTASGGGITSVTGVGPITANTISGAVTVNCPNCVDTVNTQTINATKVIDDVASLEFVNSTGLTVGRLNQASWVFGPLAAGAGRGVSISNSGILLFNIAGMNSATINTGGLITASGFGIQGGSNGLTGACTTFPIVMGGLVVSC